MADEYANRRQRVLGARAAFQAWATGSAGDISAEVSARLGALLGHVRQSSWWRDYLPAAAFEGGSLGSIPVMSRALVQEQHEFMRIWVEGSQDSDYQLMSTSGSTGQWLFSLLAWSASQMQSTRPMDDGLRGLMRLG